MKAVVIGGTGFIGTYQVQYALDRGHTVTLFNRGRTNPQLFPTVEKLIGDRNNDLLRSVTIEAVSERQIGISVSVSVPMSEAGSIWLPVPSERLKMRVSNRRRVEKYRVMRRPSDKALGRGVARKKKSRQHHSGGSAARGHASEHV